MLKRKYFVLVWLMIFSLVSVAQHDIPIGSWRAHYTYYETHLVEKVNDKIFVVGKSGLLIYNLSNESLTQLTKIDGLSESETTAIAFDDASNTLILGHKNGSIDIIRENGISNILDLKQSGIVETKTIRHISFYQNLAYLSTAFGVVVLDLDKDQIQTAYQNLGPNGESIQVNQSVISNTDLFLATQVGVISVDLNSGLLLEDFNNWTRYAEAPFDGLNVISAAIHDNRIYIVTNNTIYWLNNDAWEELDPGLNAGEDIRSLKNSDEHLIMLTDQAINLLSIADDGSYTKSIIMDAGDPNDIITDDQGMLWYADGDSGLSRYANPVERFLPNSPVNEQIEKLKFVNGEMLAFPKLDQNTSAKSSNGLGYASFQNGEWTEVTPEDILGLDNITDVTFTQDRAFISSFGSSLLDSANATIYNEDNSPLEHFEAVMDNIIVTGAAEDAIGNIWVTSFGDNSLSTLSEGGNWAVKNFGFSASREPNSITINQSGQIWMTLGRVSGRGVLGYDPDQDMHRLFNVGSGSLPSSTINQISFDLDGDLWMASNNGVAYIPFAVASIEDNTLNALRPIFDGGHLFEGREVTSVVVDGGNRKWFGLENGVWLFSENGNELVHHFNTENSPLPSNNILAIAINHQNGEVFISTDNGLISYRSDATQGRGSHQQVKIFPNPVTPDYTGWVGFDGLVNDARLKITTISGRLVREVQAYGGGASWDVKDYLGNRPKTGVYLVFSANSDGTETFVGKIAIIE